VVPSSPIFGVGPARYGGGAVTALHDTSIYDKLGLPYGVYGTEGYIDNNWFSLFGETGVLGLLAYLWLYSAVFFACIHIALNSKDRATRALALGTAAAMIAVALNALLATMLETRTLAPYLWIMGGTVIALGKKEELL
jgi:O-antigen ligase